MEISRYRVPIADNIYMWAVREEYPEHSLFYLNLDITPNKDLKRLPGHISAYMQKQKLDLLSGFIFGPDGAYEYQWPEILSDMIFLKHKNSSGCQIQLICTDSKEVRSKEYNEKTKVRTLDHQGLKLTFIGNISPYESGTRYSQAYSSFKLLAEIIRDQNIGLNGLARTWLFLESILEWYNTLNKVRNEFFAEEGINNALVPASTGIGLGNIHSRCILINALCIGSEAKGDLIRTVESPLQCSATDYRSSFSRAVEIKHHSSRRLLVSGTASISEEGNTLHKNKFIQQVDHTLKVVRAMLGEENYEWNDIVRSIAYFRYPEDIKLFKEFCLENDIDSTYILPVAGTICRDDLLFEIELDAVKSINHRGR